MQFKSLKIENDDSSRIDITPLIDIIFQLIIFFMLTSNFAIQKGIRVNLPEAKASEGIVIDKINIQITTDRKVHLNSEEVDLQTLGQKTAALHHEFPDASVNLAADGMVYHEDVIRVMDILRQEDITKIAIQTELLKEDRVEP